MIRNLRIKKTIGAFFLVLMLTNVLAPTVSWALTSGPTAPEATSFEPVDTTDMVNLSSGDFTYNTPLIEVPGPGGSYPVSLSYHAGIQPHEDASWVGLGWTLNPGSLNRMVNGYPDDFYGNQFMNRTFWEGGNTETYTIGLSVGVGSAANVSAGLSVSHDTYQGYGVGAYIGAGVQIGSFDASGRVGISPYGGPYASAGVGLSIGKSVGNLNFSLRGGLNTSTQGGSGAGLSGGVSYKKPEEVKKDKNGKPVMDENGDPVKTKTRQWSPMHASIGTGSTKPALSVGGGSIGIATSREGVVSTKSDNFAIDIPIWPTVSIHLGRSYVRYWIDETETASIYGALNMHYQSFTDNKGFDAYNNFSGAYDAASGKSTDELNGGTYADYDSYMVNAQGVSGSIRPHHYKVNVGRQNLKKQNDPYTVKTYQSAGQQYSVTSKVEYHFVNDFSNRVLSDPPQVQIGSGSNPISFPEFTPQTGLNDGHDVPNVPGSRHIEYFSNYEMVNERSVLLNRGFLDSQSKGFVRDLTGAANQVGGFKITNPSGVTYHFSLPAYSFNERTYTENKDHVGGDRFNYLKNNNKYAYTWYLTAVTGPDFVDRNSNGFADSGDWGYWVSLEYGLWSKEYRWRNPGEGYNADVDKNFNSFSKGKKELYFLNKIITNTHTALFVKELRKDGKGTTANYSEAVITSGSNHIAWTDQGGYLPKINNEWSAPDNMLYPVSQLKLKSIYLLKNTDVPNQLESSSQVYHQNDPNIVYHNGNNVVDIYDFAANQTQIINNSIKNIDFETDYSLCSKTANSFTTEIDVLNTTGLSPDYNLDGKLTLTSIKIKGKAGADMMPPTQFNYEASDQPPLASAIVSLNSQKSEATFAVGAQNTQLFEIGDVVKFNQSNVTTFGYVRSKSATEVTVRMLAGQSLPSLGSITEFKKTKNPPYHKEMHDIWSFFKSDFKEYGAAYNQQRLTTQISSKNLDAWSLQGITSTTGAKIGVNYEADQYTKSVYYKNFSLPLSFVTQINDPQTGDPLPQPIVTLRGNIWGEGDIQYTDYFYVGKSVDLIAVYSNQTAVPGGPLTATPYLLTNGIVQEVTPTTLTISTNIQHVPENRYHKANVYLGASLNVGGGIRVKSVSITDELTNKKSTSHYEYENGVTSFEPVITDDFTISTGFPVVDSFYKEMMLQGFVKLVTVGREIPPPGVIYGKVRMKEGVTTPDGIESLIPEYSQYEFQTFVDGMVESVGIAGSNSNVSGSSHALTYSQVQTTKRAIRNFSQLVGNLKSITLFDGQGKKVNETINQYLHDQNLVGSVLNTQNYISALTAYHSQGVMQEVFSSAKFVKRPDNNYNVFAAISIKENYPSIQVASTNINFKTGITTKSKNLSFDFYSGEVLKTYETDGFGNSYMTEVKPAYTVYPQMAMKEHFQFNPSKSNNKHMITQTASSSIFKVSDENSMTKIGLVSASAQTWTDQTPILNQSLQTGVWRQKANFTFIGDDNTALRTDGLYPNTNFTEFTAWAPGTTITNGWQKNSEIKLFDTYSHALEAADLNGNFAATKMSLDQTRVFATASNAQYSEFAFSGLEETVGPNGALGGGVKLEGTFEPVTAHTGSFSASAAVNTKGFSYKFNNTSSKKYHVAVWANRSDAVLKLNASIIPTTFSQAGSWYLIEGDIDITVGSNIEISCEARNATTLFDDFRVHPLKAAMVSYVYNKWGELTHILDNNNLFTEYEYDGMGRLTKVYKETFLHGRTNTSETVYHYANH